MKHQRWWWVEIYLIGNGCYKSLISSRYFSASIASFIPRIISQCYMISPSHKVSQCCLRIIQHNNKIKVFTLNYMITNQFPFFFSLSSWYACKTLCQISHIKGREKQMQFHTVLEYNHFRFHYHCSMKMIFIQEGVYVTGQVFIRWMCGELKKTLEIIIWFWLTQINKIIINRWWWWYWQSKFCIDPPTRLYETPNNFTSYSLLIFINSPTGITI